MSQITEVHGNTVYVAVLEEQNGSTKYFLPVIVGRYPNADIALDAANTHAACEHISSKEAEVFSDRLQNGETIAQLLEENPTGFFHNGGERAVRVNHVLAISDVEAKFLNRLRINA